MGDSPVRSMKVSQEEVFASNHASASRHGNSSPNPVEGNPPQSTPMRFQIVDVVRGVAIVGMVGYHALVDIGPAFYGLIAVDAMEQPLLRLFARIILTTFLLLVGVGLVLAQRRAFNLRRFVRRVLIVVVAAAMVTIATRIAVPDAYVRFGVLHAIALGSVLGVPFVKAPLWLAIAGILLVLAAPSVARNNFFNEPAWLWLGLSTDLPAMFDYVPMLPWFSVVLIGIVLGRVGLRALELTRSWTPRGWVPIALAKLGRASLIVYLVHQPILLGGLFILVTIAGWAA